MSQYPTNLTDKQWQVTEIILDPQHRKRKYSLRDIMDAIMYIVKTGCQWRMLPRDFPPFNTVFYYFNKWKLGAEFTVVLRPDESSKKFNVLPLRWIVGRSFSWLESFRRIAMDYEFYSDTGEAMVQLAFCRLMYNKIYD